VRREGAENGWRVRSISASPGRNDEEWVTRMLLSLEKIFITTVLVPVPTLRFRVPLKIALIDS
jgi:hypothetical protein